METLRQEMTRKIKPDRSREGVRTITLPQYCEEMRVKRTFDNFAAMMARCM